MVTFVQVDPADLDTSRLGRRGRVSYPLVKSFMEANIKLGKIDMAGYEKNPQYLRSVLTSYINNHHLPLKIFSAQGDLHLMRLDIDNNGVEIPDWDKKLRTTEGAAGHLQEMAPAPINAAEVQRRFEEEGAKTTR